MPPPQARVGTFKFQFRNKIFKEPTYVIDANGETYLADEYGERFVAKQTPEKSFNNLFDEAAQRSDGGMLQTGGELGDRAADFTGKEFLPSHSPEQIGWHNRNVMNPYVNMQVQASLHNNQATPVFRQQWPY